MRLFKKAKSTTVTMIVDPNGSKGNHTPIDPDLIKSLKEGVEALNKAQANMSKDEISLVDHSVAVEEEVEYALEEGAEDKGSALTADEVKAVSQEAIEGYLSGLEGDEITMKVLKGLMKEIKATYGIVID